MTEEIIKTFYSKPQISIWRHVNSPPIYPLPLFSMYFHYFLKIRLPCILHLLEFASNKLNKNLDERLIILKINSLRRTVGFKFVVTKIILLIFWTNFVIFRHVAKLSFNPVNISCKIHITPGLTLWNSTSSPQTVLTCFVWISEQTVIISLLNRHAVCLLRRMDWTLKYNCVVSLYKPHPSLSQYNTIRNT